MQGYGSAMLVSQVLKENFDVITSRLVSMSTVLCIASIEREKQTSVIATGSADGLRLWEYFLDASGSRSLTVGSSSLCS